MRIFTIIIFVVFSFFSSLALAYRPQEIVLYTETNFTGRSKSFYESVTDLKSDSVGRVAKSHCVVRGLWRVSGTFVNSTPPAKFIENVYGDEKHGKVCGTWNTNNNNNVNVTPTSNTSPLLLIEARYKSLLLIGSQDLDTPAIQFHTQSRFYGDPALYLDGRVLKLDKPLNFSSFGFTGKHNWTVFRGTDLSGHSTCLVAELDGEGRSVVSFNVNKSLTVGSIWRGCGSLDPKVLGRQMLENKGARGESGIRGLLQSFLIMIGLMRLTGSVFLG